MVVAVPVGLLAAIYLAPSTRPPGSGLVVKPVLEILAGIPTVVYGFFAVLTGRRPPCAGSATRSE